MLGNTIFEDVYSNMIFEQNNKKAIQDAARQCDKLMSSLNSKQGVAKLKKFLQTNPIMQKLIKEFEITKSIANISNLAFESVIFQQDQEQNKEEKKEEKQQSTQQQYAELKQMIQQQNELIKKLSKKVGKKSILPNKVKQILIATAVLGVGAVAAYKLYPHIFPKTAQEVKLDYNKMTQQEVIKKNNQDIKDYNEQLKSGETSVRNEIDKTQATVAKTAKTIGRAATHPVEAAKETGKNFVKGVKGIFSKSDKQQ